jgi:hypothetical protein
MKRRRRIGEAETIPFDDERMNYYREPWERSQTGDGPVVRTSTLNDYVDIWYLRFEHLEWWSEKAPTNGIAGFTIWGKDWTIQEMINLYSPTKDSKIELIMERDYPLDDYTVTLINIGEKDPDAIGNDLVHAYFKIK